MKRKTNLFYTSGSDSNFITFSNYTESLTGNFLATDVKLFPSKFLCLNIPSLTAENRDEFIKYIAARYENKAAFLRDCCIKRNYNIELMIKPLGWLLDAIMNYDVQFEITYVGQVVEQDYNGIYADTICTIDASSYNRPVITGSSEYDATYVEDYAETESMRYLYGWYNVNASTGSETFIGPQEYGSVAPQLDFDTKYYYSSLTKSITINIPEQAPDSIEFNVIIPLYDIVNVNYKENFDTITDMTVIDCAADNASVINVPLGIWFSQEPVILTKNRTDYLPSWSLVISSQFKPFPYSQFNIEEINQSERLDAFNTFARILVKQNRILDKISNISAQMTDFNERLNALTANINNSATTANVDEIQKEVIDLQNAVKDLQEQI